MKHLTRWAPKQCSPQCSSRLANANDRSWCVFSTCQGFYSAVVQKSQIQTEPRNTNSCHWHSQTLSQFLAAPDFELSNNDFAHSTASNIVCLKSVLKTFLKQSCFVFISVCTSFEALLCHFYRVILIFFNAIIFTIVLLCHSRFLILFMSSLFFKYVNVTFILLIAKRLFLNYTSIHKYGKVSKL